MSTPIHALEYLDNPHLPAGVCVLYGDEPFLKRLVLRYLRKAVSGDEQNDVLWFSVDGDSAQWRDVADQLATVSLFGKGQQLVCVQDADKFVSEYRSQLEHYVSHACPTSLLVLDVASWPSNTRLYRSVAEKGLAIQCSPPERMIGKRKEIDHAKLIGWLRKRSAQYHERAITAPAAGQLLELVGPNLGLLDQELAKLALVCEPDSAVTPEMVAELVGGWRHKTTWDLLEAASDGNAAEALRQLDRLLAAGEQPVALFGAISWSLRRFADVTRIIERSERLGHPADLRRALQQAGFRSWPKPILDRAEAQLRQIGRQRAGKLHRWLLAADLALKGTHSAPERARMTLEMLILRLAKETRPFAARC